jgi:hypothetical protein
VNIGKWSLNYNYPYIAGRYFARGEGRLFLAIGNINPIVKSSPSALARRSRNQVAVEHIVVLCYKNRSSSAACKYENDGIPFRRCG